MLIELQRSKENEKHVHNYRMYCSRFEDLTFEEKKQNYVNIWIIVRRVFLVINYVMKWRM